MIGCPDEAGIGVLVSAISCFGDSSMHRTGYRGSNRRLYTSNTISIFATKLLFCSGGITQPFCFQGLISFCWILEFYGMVGVGFGTACSDDFTDKRDGKC
jgi:hypothetical protein